MSKSFLFRFFLGAVAVAMAVLWLLSITMSDKFGWFNLSWAIFGATAAGAIAFLFRGIFSKNLVQFKKLNVYIGTGLAVVALYALVSAITVPKNIILPIVAIIVTVGLLLAFVAVGGKKWDQADNKNVGYKDYRTRKKEEEERNK